MSPDMLEQMGVRLVERPWGLVILTKLDQNTEAFRKALWRWLDTEAGRRWRFGVEAVTTDDEAAA